MLSAGDTGMNKMNKISLLMEFIPSGRHRQ